MPLFLCSLIIIYYLYFIFVLGLVLISSLMALTSLAMFSFPKHLKGNRIPPPMKLRAIEAQKKQNKQEEEPKTPQLKGLLI